MEECPYEIRFASQDDWESAIGLVWKTFLEFEAADYPAEGIRSFEDFITDTGLKRMFAMGTYQMMLAFQGEQIIGVISLRNQMHISLLFVDKHFHRRGVGRALVRRMAEYVKNELGENRLTVNSSPYGVDFYHRVGFRDLESQKQQDGIIFTPMEYIF